jgi:secretion/DNA translocation related TadE-like protein
VTLRRSEVHDRRLDAAGIATVWAMAWMMVLATFAGIGGLLGMAAARQHQVDAAADLAALSAAARLQHGGDACAAAQHVAVANRADLTRCRVAGGDVVVAVSQRLFLPFGLHVQISGRARAGPG